MKVEVTVFWYDGNDFHWGYAWLFTEAALEHDDFTIYPGIDLQFGITKKQIARDFHINCIIKGHHPIVWHC